MTRLTRGPGAALVVALALSLFAGCGGSGGEGDGPTSEQERRWADRTLIVAAPSTPSTLDGDAMSDPVDFTAHWNLYDQLVGWEQAGSDPVASQLDEVAARIASKWSVSDDGTVYDFTLEPVANSSGRQLTAQDVKDQWTAAYHRNGVGRLIYTVSNIPGPDAIEVLGERRIRFTLSAPSALFLRALTIHTAGAQDTRAFEKQLTKEDPYGSKWLKSNAAGFGPYEVERFDSGSQVVFQANPEFWDGEPYFTTVIYKAVPSVADRLALLRTGEVDVAEGLSPRDYETLREASNVEVLTTPGLSAVSLRFNMNIAPFDDPRVRKAIAHAVPVDRIVEEVYYGKARQAKSIFPDALPGYRPIWDTEYDPERARQLLAEAGDPDGLRVDFHYSAAVPQMENLGVILQEALREVGIAVQLSPTPPQAFTDGLFSQKFGFFADTDKPLVPDEGYTLFLWFGESPINYTGYENPAVSRAIERALALDLGPERERIVDGAMQTVLDDVAWAPLAFVDSQIATAKGLTGHTWYPLDVMRWSDLRPEDAPASE